MKPNPDERLIYSYRGQFIDFDVTPSKDLCPPLTQERSVLIVDDQLGYRELMIEAIAELFRDVQIRTAKDAEEAWALLNPPAESDRLPLYPSLIISDLNLPRVSGVELLQRIKNDPQLNVIPVIIFSTSEEEQDILRCYQAQANCFIHKPRDVNLFFQVVQHVVNFWLNLTLIPNLVDESGDN